MNKKRIASMLIAVLLFGVFCVGMTYALLMSRSPSIVNTFVSGDIDIALSETTGSEYLIVPGCTIEKNPRITVGAGSEECWLFVEAESDDALEAYATYSIADGWTFLEGTEGVYWRRVSQSSTGRVYPVLKGDGIQVSENVTEEMLSSLQDGFKLTFSAYAVQYEGISTPEKAWDIIIKSKEDEA